MTLVGHVTLLRWVGVVLKVKLGVLAEGLKASVLDVVLMCEDCGKRVANQKRSSSIACGVAFKSILFTVFLPLLSSLPFMFALFLSFQKD